MGERDVEMRGIGAGEVAKDSGRAGGEGGKGATRKGGVASRRGRGAV